MANMDPYGQLPAATRKSSELREVSASQPRPGPSVIINSPHAEGLAAVVGEDVQKPLRGEKERLPEADNVDVEHILQSVIDALESPATPMAEGPVDDAGGPPTATVADDFDAGFLGNPSTIPPDTHGAPGTFVVMATLNNRVWWHGRDGTHRSDVSLDAFWNVFDRQFDTFDPKLFHDELTGRYIFVTCADAERETSSVLVAVSTGSDPEGTWVFAQIPRDVAEMGDVWMDYASVGFTEDKITICLNLFSIPDNQFSGAAVFVIDKAGFMATPSSFDYDQFVMTDQGGTLCPAIASNPGTTDQYLVSNWTGDFQGKGFLALYRVTGTVAAGDTAFNRIGFLEIDNTWAFTSPTSNFAPQMGSTTGINNGDSRMHWVAHRHGRLYVAQTVFLPSGNPDHSAVQWAEISLGATPGVTDHGLLGDDGDGHFYAFPSLAVNTRGDVVIGMAAFADAIFASGAYAYKPAGGSYTAPQIFAPGQNSYVLTFSGTRNRWGDYSSTHVDPANATDFWTIQEYAGADENTWRTRWARITVPPAVGS